MELTAFDFRVKQSKSVFMVCLTLKLEAPFSSGPSVTIHWSTWHTTPENSEVKGIAGLKTFVAKYVTCSSV